MRILYINDKYDNLTDGAAISVKLLAEAMAVQCEVAVFATTDMNEFVDYEEINNVKIYRCFYSERKTALIHKFARYARRLRNRNVNRAVIQALDEFKPEIIHTNSISRISTLVWKTAKEKGMSVIHTSRDDSMLFPSVIVSKNYNCPLYLRPFLSIYRYYLKRMSLYVDGYVAVSEYISNLYLNNGYFNNSKLQRIIWNSVSINEKQLNRNIESRRTKIKTDEFRFLYAGRLERIKGIIELIKAFSEIDNKNVRLIICGRGDLEDSILDYMKNDTRIEYKGSLDFEELSNEYIAADCCVIPSTYQEAFGRVVIESQLFGCPVIVSNRGGMPEIIAHTGGGIVCNIDENTGLINAMKIMLESAMEGFYESILLNMYKYDIGEQIRSYIEIYERMLL